MALHSILTCLLKVPMSGVMGDKNTDNRIGIMNINEFKDHDLGENQNVNLCQHFRNYVRTSYSYCTYLSNI